MGEQILWDFLDNLIAESEGDGYVLEPNPHQTTTPAADTMLLHDTEPTLLLESSASLDMDCIDSLFDDEVCFTSVSDSVDMPDDTMMSPYLHGSAGACPSLSHEHLSVPLSSPPSSMLGCTGQQAATSGQGQQQPYTFTSQLGTSSATEQALPSTATISEMRSGQHVLLRSEAHSQDRFEPPPAAPDPGIAPPPPPFQANDSLISLPSHLGPTSPWPHTCTCEHHSWGRADTALALSKKERATAPVPAPLLQQEWPATMDFVVAQVSSSSSPLLQPKAVLPPSLEGPQPGAGTAEAPGGAIAGGQGRSLAATGSGEQGDSPELQGKRLGSCMAEKPAKKPRTTETENDRILRTKAEWVHLIATARDARPDISGPPPEGLMSFFAVMSVMWKDGLLTGSGLTTSTSQLLPAAEEGGVWVIRWSLSLCRECMRSTPPLVRDSGRCKGHPFDTYKAWVRVYDDAGKERRKAAALQQSGSWAAKLNAAQPPATARRQGRRVPKTGWERVKLGNTSRYGECAGSSVWVNWDDLVLFEKTSNSQS